MNIRTAIADYLIQFDCVKKAIQPYMRKTQYEIGFNGIGPTALDIKPPEFTPTLQQKIIWWFFIPINKTYKKLESEHRQYVWKEVTKGRY